jgi:hypothetical protein
MFHYWLLEEVEELNRLLLVWQTAMQIQEHQEEIISAILPVQTGLEVLVERVDWMPMRPIQVGAVSTVPSFEKSAKTSKRL